MASPLFGIVPAGLPLITEPTSIPSDSFILYSLPSTNTFSHIVVFLLPNVTLPQSTAAAIYLAAADDVAAAAGSGGSPSLQFLGGLGPGKESAIFKIRAGAESEIGSGVLMIGISIESAESVARRLDLLAAEKALALSSPAPRQSQLTTADLAQRIIQNAFNFLASFSGGTGPGGLEVVPLRAFEDWWRKFESRVRSDPSFLERQSP